MKNYRKIKIGDVLDIKRGMSLAGEYYATEGKYIRLTLGNFNYPECGWKDNITKENLYYSGPLRNEFLLKKGDIITPLTEQVRGLLGNTARIPKNNIYIQSGDIGLVIPDETKINRNFAYYLISSSVVKRQLDAGSQQTKIRHTCPEAIKDCVAFLPELSQQQKIATILDFIENKIQSNIKINNNLQELMNTFYDYYFIKQMQNNVSNCSKLLCKDILEVKTGKEDANFGNSNGKYKFFTCSKETINCDKPAFSGQSILIAGNGDFNVKHYNGEFNAYQRTYVLIPSDSLYYGTLYMSALKLVQKFKKASSGSIVKFISKSDVENIEIIIPNNHNLLLSLNKYLGYIEKNEKENERLIKIRNFLLPLLMNGQATIDE